MVAQIDKKYIKISKRRTLVRLISYFLEGRPITTKGRFINPFLQFSFSIIKYIFPRNKNITICYVSGTGRSGTTFIGQILSMHHDIGFLNEPKLLWHSAYPDEDVIGNYSNNVMPSYRLTKSESSLSVSNYFHRLYSFYSFLTRSSIILDKYPESVFRYDFCMANDSRCKFILLVRNGWDTIYSIDLWSKRLGRNDGTTTKNWWGVDDLKWKRLVYDIASNDEYFSGFIEELINWDNHTHRAAVEWILVMKECNKLRSLPNTLLIKYEDLCAKPASSLEEITSFLDIEQDKNMAFYANSSVSIPGKKPNVELPVLIQDEFNRVMNLFNY